MNKLTIIGNLTRDPDLRTTRDGISVCSFTVAVSRRRKSQNASSPQQETDFFRVTAWRQLGENCSQYLVKGKKVCVIGPVTVSTYQASDGQTRANLEVTAEDIEFISPRIEDSSSAPSESEKAAAQPSGFIEVNEDDLPF